jgi:tetratricopeptide (TPR) repeat protein
MKCYPLFIFILIGQVVFPQSAVSNPEILRPSALQNYQTGRDLEAKNRMEEAMSYYNQAVQICLDTITQNPSAIEAYEVLTWTLQRQRRYADVISWGERGLKLNANNYRIIEIMGEAYFYLDNYDRSLTLMQHYVNSLPQGERTSVAYFFIGEIFRLRGRFYHADIAYTTAVRLEPNLPLWWYRLGSVRESVGEYKPAIEAYERALKLNPEYLEANAGLERSKKRNV